MGKTKKKGSKTVKKAVRKKSKKKESEEMKPSKNGQSWSIDLIVGVIIFMLIIAIFYAFVGSKPEDPLEQLEEDARGVTAQAEGQKESLGLMIDGKINETRFNELCDMDYDNLTATLGIENDLCIYLEDEYGEIIPCGTSGRAGIGNGRDIDLGNGIMCGQVIA